MRKKLLLGFLAGLLSVLLCFSGCAWIAPLSGGGSYDYERFDPSTGERMHVAIRSSRKIRNAQLCFCPDGNVTINIESVEPGENNMKAILSMAKNSLLLAEKALSKGAL
jgi:hypothetical protein